MSTNPTVPPSDPQPTAPETIDINTPIETIRNAYMEKQSQESQAAPAEPEPPAAPEPPVAPVPIEGEGYKMFTLPDGRLHMKLDTGEEFFGSSEKEVLGKLAKSKVDTTQWSRGLRDEIKTLRESLPKAPEPPPVQKTPEQIAQEEARQWMLNEVAVGLGFANAQEMQLALNRMGERTQQVALDAVTNQFLSTNQDFPNTQESVEAMFKVAEEIQQRYGVKEIDAQLLGDAHALAIRRGLYQPLSKELQQAALAGRPNVPSPVRPAPVLPVQAPTNTVVDENPWAMPMDKLRDKMREEEAKSRG